MCWHNARTMHARSNGAAVVEMGMVAQRTEHGPSKPRLQRPQEPAADISNAL